MKIFLLFLMMMFLLINGVCAELLFSYSNNIAGKFSEPEELKLYVYRLRHQDPENFAQQLKLLYPDEKIVTYKHNTSVGLYTTAKKYKLMLSVLESLDCEVNQIKIEVEILEVNRNLLAEIGIKWDTDKTQPAADNLMVVDDIRVFARIKAAKQNGQARLKANPTLVVKDSCMATVKIGDKVPVAVPEKDKETYSISYLDAGIKLQILPRIISENYVGSLVQPEVSSIKGWKATSAGEYPVISTKEAMTEVTVKSEQMFIIAGLTSQDDRRYDFEIPWFSTLPFIGGLFRFDKHENDETEIIFCIKPTIIKM